MPAVLKQFARKTTNIFESTLSPVWYTCNTFYYCVFWFITVCLFDGTPITLIKCYAAFWDGNNNMNLEDLSVFGPRGYIKSSNVTAIVLEPPFVIQDIAYCRGIWELLDTMQRMLWFIFIIELQSLTEAVDNNRNWQSQRSQWPRYDAEFAPIPPFPWQSPGKWSHTDSLLRTIHCLTHRLSGSVQPPPCKLSHKGNHSIWQGEEAILQRWACALWPSRPSLHEHRSLELECESQRYCLC